MDELLLGRSVDAHLNALGERQARSLGDRLSSVTDMVCECSPRRRARQTAAAIAASAKCEVITALVLDEMDFGAWSGRSFTELQEDPQWRHWNAHRSSAQTPAGDSVQAVQVRVMQHLRRLQDSFPRRTIVLVTHAEIIRATVLHCLRAPIDSHARLAIGPASLTTLTLDGTGVRVDGVNERLA